MQIKDDSILYSLKNNGKFFGILSAIGGFIGDVLQPLAPFSEYIFYILLIGIVPLLLLYFFSISLKTRVVPFLSFSIIFAFITGGVFGLQLASNNNDNGVLSAVVPGIEKLQASLGIIDKKLVSIKEDTEEIKKSTTKISKKLDTLNKNIGKQGGIILNPSTFEEWYSNARHYELKGDFLNTRKSYLKYFTYKKDYIDPHLNFFKLLKIQEGRAGAREAYADLKTMYPSIAVEVVYALLLDVKKKIKELERLAIEYPNYSPILYILSKEYSPEKRGEQTLEEIKIEKEYLEKFLVLAEEGAYLKYYLDKNEAVKHLENAKIRLNTILVTFKSSSAIENPVTLSSVVYVGGDMLINIDIPETAPEVSYSYGENPDYHLTVIVPFRIKGRYIAAQSMQLSSPRDLKGKFRFLVKYKDIKGQEHGPFDLSFIPADEVAKYKLAINKMLNKNHVKKVDGDIVYNKECASCHGANGERSALGKSKKITGQNAAKTVEQLNAYKSDNLNQYGRGDIMQIPVTHFMDDATIKAVADHIEAMNVKDNPMEKKTMYMQEYMFKGYGEECSVYADGAGTLKLTNCLQLTNLKGVRILCTLRKTKCKTISEISDDIDHTLIKVTNRAVEPTDMGLDEIKL